MYVPSKRNQYASLWKRNVFCRQYAIRKKRRPSSSRTRPLVNQLTRPRTLRHVSGESFPCASDRSWRNSRTIQPRSSL
jgi:hypothetical protein